MRLIHPEPPQHSAKPRQANVSPETFNAVTTIYRPSLAPKEPETIREWYDALSKNYDELYGHEQGEKHRRVIETLGPREFEKFVDVGCGTGRLLELVSSRSRFALGIDISLQMLRKAKQRTGGIQIQFVRADASHLPLRDHVSDGVASVSVAESGLDFAKQLRELSRIAAESAVLSMTVFDDKNRTCRDQLKEAGMELVGSWSDREELWTRRPNPS